MTVAEERESSVEVEISRICSFRGHPFKVLDDERMDELVKSIRENGVLSPVLIRPAGDGSYEMISGHRRLRASQLTGLTTIPAIVRKLTDEEATIAMVDANIQREELLPSEKAFAYRMKMEALKNQGARCDLTSRHGVGKLEEKAGDPTSRQNVGKSEAADVLGKSTGESGRQVQRYIRLTEVIPEILELVDQKKFPFMVAVEISYIDKRVQRWVYEYYIDRGKLRVSQIKALRKVLAESRGISEYKVMDVLNEGLKKPETTRRVFTDGNRLDLYFPAEYTTEQMEEVICSLLQEWSGKLKNKSN